LGIFESAASQRLTKARRILNKRVRDGEVTRDDFI